ncbi:putative hydrolase of the HAD superfamily [Flavobacteriaceae bacterium MAR_2010_72]|nr:putative hydrolase of the HAD superfamily [Flavobacteriaceae bacterium MAR_2010_72]TVZ59413.1 putative hydrolase of the HAD superfamily [Flavobacteriaceae bacterium MAR_2010_105]
MIKNLIFDFGDVFINLDKEGAMNNALQLFKLNEFPNALFETNHLYEQGLISTDEFLAFYQKRFPWLSKTEIIDAWNYILKDFPLHRLEFIQRLASNKTYKLILLSNTNHLHIDWIKNNVPFYNTFKNCFDDFYLSQDIQMRKPNKDIYEFVLTNSTINPNETLFIDDTPENTLAASRLGIHVWNIDPFKEDVTTLFTTKNQLF